MRPYYQHAGITIYNGDCLEVLPQLELSNAFVITDPPYNAKKNYGTGTKDNQPWPEWAAWLDERMIACLPAAGGSEEAMRELNAAYEAVTD